MREIITLEKLKRYASGTAPVLGIPVMDYPTLVFPRTSLQAAVEACEAHGSTEPHVELNWCNTETCTCDLIVEGPTFRYRLKAQVEFNLTNRITGPQSTGTILRNWAATKRKARNRTKVDRKALLIAELEVSA